MSIEIERKFLLATTPDWSIPVLRSAKVIDFEQVYLRVDGKVQERIRRSRIAGDVFYHYARLTPTGHATREVFEEELNREAYERARLDRDPTRQIVRKIRRCFTWRDQFFELDDITQPETRGCLLMEIQVNSLEQKVTLPDFLEFDKEVTDDPAYSNASIALG